jgi:hypothetical protein
VHHQRGADLAALQRGPERVVARVVPAHEPDLDQPPAAGHLGVDDPLARLRGRGQRFLAEHRLARLDRGQHVLLVGRPPRGDQDRVDLRVGDQVPAGRVHRHAGQARGDLLGADRIHVGDRHDHAPGQDLGDPAYVVLADHSDADDADADRHHRSPPPAGVPSEVPSG